MAGMVAGMTQLYVYLKHNTSIDWTRHYEAELKQGNGDGTMLALKTAWGESPDEALRGLCIEDNKTITFVREVESEKHNAI